jgi:uncharacterized OB-fold protein/acyl dehydratase
MMNGESGMVAIEADAVSSLNVAAERIIAAGESDPRPARDPVNLPIIENWTEAIGDTNPVYTDAEYAAGSVHGGLVAPPAMIQVWTMQGLRTAQRSRHDPMGQIVAALDGAGYTSVVATNCDQVYFRYLRHGEQLTSTVSLTDLVGPKRTALGEGWFFTTRHTWYSAGEAVATMDFRILKFAPPQADQQARTPAPAGPDLAGPDLASTVMRPVISPDTAFFWAGTAVGDLRIQSCGDCAALRHPPGPMCLECGSPNPRYVVAAGTGEVFSYIVHHHPPVPGKRLPMVLALVELTEGVRVLGELVGIDPDQVSIGLPVRAEYLRIDDELTLPAWRPVSAGPAELPELAVDASTTFVIASALATRDFTAVHHDRDFAVASGSKDIFLNILTTTGLVQRFVSGWAGPQSIVRSIAIRLGAPCYAGDTLRFSGRVTEQESEEGYDKYTVAVTGRCGLGDHVTSTVRIDVPCWPGGTTPPSPQRGQS